MTEESLLDTAEVPQDEPVICTITGDAGVGKTSLAASFPSPIFIQAEKGLQSIPANKRPKALPLIQSSSQLYDQLRALVRDKHEYKTLVIDSVTALESLFIKEVCEADKNSTPEKTISISKAAGGYGAGRDMVAGMHQKIRAAAEALRVRRGMNVVFIAHAETEKLDLPDTEPYTRFVLRLHEKSQSFYVDNVDLVGFLRLQVFAMGDSDAKVKKAVSDGTRILICHASAANVSKNRYGITEPLLVQHGVNPLIQYIPTLQPAGE